MCPNLILDIESVLGSFFRFRIKFGLSGQPEPDLFCIGSCSGLGFLQSDLKRKKGLFKNGTHIWSKSASTSASVSGHPLIHCHVGLIRD